VAISVRMVARLSAVILMAGGCPAALAGDRGDWFKSLKMPGTKASCCDLGDCHATQADWREGQWWAVVNDEWRPVPQSQVLTSPHSIDGSAYVCNGSPSWSIGGEPSKPPIYCFVPPNLPM
jgi:hypothetical protein